MKLDERGSTLIEVVVVTAIIAIIGCAATMSIYQVVSGAERSNEHITAIDQVQNAAYWITRDVHRAQDVFTDNLSTPDFLIVCWTDWDSGDKYQVVYSLEDVSGSSLKRLERNESVNGGIADTISVARYINAETERTYCEYVNGSFNCTIEAVVSLGAQERSETRVISVLPRPD